MKQNVLTNMGLDYQQHLIMRWAQNNVNDFIIRKSRNKNWSNSRHKELISVLNLFKLKNS